jgi:hypothetical protein
LQHGESLSATPWASNISFIIENKTLELPAPSAHPTKAMKKMA